MQQGKISAIHGAKRVIRTSRKISHHGDAHDQNMGQDRFLQRAKVLWCCAELGIDFERLDWGGKFGGNNDKAYREMNPNGLVPTLKDGDFILWESNSIMRYLNVKYGGGKLLPAKPEGMANANRWMDWQLSAFNATIVPLFWNLVRTPADKRDPKAVEAALDKTIKAWQVVEDHLAKSHFLGGGGIFARRHSARGLGLPLV